MGCLDDCGMGWDGNGGVGYISGGQGGSLVCGKRTLTVDNGAPEVVFKVAGRSDPVHSSELENAMIGATKNMVVSRNSRVKRATFFKEGEEDEV